jgi:hypothetical protein
MDVDLPGRDARERGWSRHPYRHGHAVGTVNRALGVLRAAINWGRIQDRPLLATSPFHRFGVNIKVRDETKRDRRFIATRSNPCSRRV